ncbi:transposase [Duodenibacillus massiliensis]|uniref:transposase n=1 Tax=Duodenibacillus massiliensis TaxID=1852381 RepID=UPI003C6CE13F
MGHRYTPLNVKISFQELNHTRRDKWGYPTELRDSIVKRLLANEIQYKDAVSEYGIPIHNLYKWVSKARAGARSEDVRFFVSRR